jgi:hypothetical protein
MAIVRSHLSPLAIRCVDVIYAYPGRNRIVQPDTPIKDKDRVAAKAGDRPLLPHGAYVGVYTRSPAVTADHTQKEPRHKPGVGGHSDTGQVIMDNHESAVRSTKQILDGGESSKYVRHSFAMAELLDVIVWNSAAMSDGNIECIDNRPRFVEVDQLISTRISDDELVSARSDGHGFNY